MEKRFSSEEISRAKQVNLREYLNLRPRQNILSPFRDESTPSFSIFQHNSGQWVGKDWGGRQEIYDSIAIIQAIEKVSFPEAVKSLLAFAEGQGQATTASQNQKDIPNIVSNKNNSPEALRIATVTAQSQGKKNIRYEWLSDNQEAIDYLVNVRKINFEVVEKVQDKIRLVDVVIDKNDRTYRNRMLAFPNMNGGWICRNINPNSPVREHIIAPAGLTVAGNQQANEVYIFESCIDMLSYISLNPAISNAMLVSLNSVSNYKKLADLQLQGKNINLCLDNDDAGWQTTKKIKKVINGYDRKDCAELYQQFRAEKGIPEKLSLVEHKHYDEKYGAEWKARKEAVLGNTRVNTDIMRCTETLRRKDINEVLSMSEDDIKNELLEGFDPNDRHHHMVLGRTQKKIFDRLFPALPEPRICTIEMRKEMSAVHDILNPIPVTENNTAYRKYTPAPGDPF